MNGTAGGGRDSPARSEMHAGGAEDQVESDPRWAQFMLWSIPECIVVRDDILVRSGPVGSVDPDELLTTVVAASRDRLRELTADRVDVTWE